MGARSALVQRDEDVVDTDGACCNTVCGGLCVGCAVSGSVGIRTNIPNGTDPANECAGNCNGAGACTP